MSKVLILNGSPRKSGTISTLLKKITEGVREKNNEIEWVDIYSLQMEPCIACMKCRPDGECVLPKDDAHIIGKKIKEVDALVIGTPTYWGNMTSQLKVLFERNVPVFMGEKPNGMPIAKQKGKRAVIVVSCTTPWPFNFIASESRGAVRAVKEVLHYGGYKVIGKIVKPGTKKNPNISKKILSKAKKMGNNL
ncbi:flavodoxin family protein [Clostridium sp. D2Q-14]|uniref:flavodoxin family protein n=1 Tax=Anaeromonas gelatinilytica TaxID=2683194 RepID=UPI00193BC246|nr:flavodoxin family protein [Anaeromonas gelatinilytica]MBS4535316.1 flavodoxin family protein [Anaeromonas gelatinilytica]